MNRLRERFLKAAEIDYEAAVRKGKIDEIESYQFMQKDKYYQSLVFAECNDDALNRMQIGIEFVETTAQHDLWTYFRVFTSSIRTFKNIGRHIRMLVKDETTGKYVGIMALGSDVRQYGARDTYIGWDRATCMRNLKYVCNITCCVGLRPTSFNYNVGKLLVALCHSKEVQEYHHRKYGHYIACITTFSINGKSIQYDRMKPYLEFVGVTQGKGMKDIPDKLYNAAMDVLRDLGDEHSLTHGSRMFKLRKVLEHLQIRDDVLAHHHPRGVYIGMTGEDSKEFLLNNKKDFTPRLPTVEAISSWWKRRWAAQRYEELKRKNGLKTQIELINPIKADNNDKVKRHNEKKRTELGESEYKKQKAAYMKEYRKKIAEASASTANEGSDMLLELHPAYVAGFIDGDGTITARGNSDGHVLLTVEISQCVPEPLQRIQRMYGGAIRKVSARGNVRTLYILTIAGKYCERLLDDVAPHAKIEQERAAIGAKMVRAYHEANDDLMKALFDEMMQASKSNAASRNYDNITDEYVAGLFDAEGSVCGRLKQRSVRWACTIAQKNDPCLLQAVAAFLGYGTVDDVRLAIYKKQHLVNFCRRIQPFLIVKKKQVEMYLEMLTNPRLSIPQLRDLCQKITDDKHVDHAHLDVEELKVTNKRLKSYMDEYMGNDCTDARKMKMAAVNKQRSENMKGEKNWNYGRERAEDHAVNIAREAMKAKHDKRKVTDDQIDEIITMHADGVNMTTIAERYDICRQYVSNILKGKVLKLSQMDDEVFRERVRKNAEKRKEGQADVDREVLHSQQTSKGKRKASANVIVQVIRHKLANPKISANKVSQQSMELFDTQLSQMQVQCFWTGKTKLFEDEFPCEGMTWDEYVAYLDRRNGCN